MSDTLRDQLLGLGFKPAPKPERPASSSTSPQRKDGRDHRPSRPSQGASARPASPPAGRRGDGRPPRDRAGHAAPRSRGEMDLAKAYAIRAQKEKDERIAAERQRQEEAARRREGKVKLQAFLATATLNDPAAEIARHFEYGAKIRRIYVTAEQLRALNAGELGVVQQGGRYHLVTSAHGREADALVPGVLALQVDPSAPPEDDIYADPRYQVPDDLVW